MALCLNHFGSPCNLGVLGNYRLKHGSQSRCPPKPWDPASSSQNLRTVGTTFPNPSECSNPGTSIMNYLGILQVAQRKVRLTCPSGLVCGVEPKQDVGCRVIGLSGNAVSFNYGIQGIHQHGTSPSVHPPPVISSPSSGSTLRLSMDEAVTHLS